MINKNTKPCYTRFALSRFQRPPAISQYLLLLLLLYSVVSTLLFFVPLSLSSIHSVLFLNTHTHKHFACLGVWKKCEFFFSDEYSHRIRTIARVHSLFFPRAKHCYTLGSGRRIAGARVWGKQKRSNNFTTTKYYKRPNPRVSEVFRNVNAFTFGLIQIPMQKAFVLVLRFVNPSVLTSED